MWRESNGFVSSHGKLKPTKLSTNVYLITKKKYYVYKTSKDLKKTVVFLSGNNAFEVYASPIQ